MCHIIELHGGIADGSVFETCDLPMALVAWHEEDADHGCTTHVVDPDEYPVPEGAVMYRRRWNHIHLLTMPAETVVTMPYDVVHERAEQPTRRQ